MISCDDDSLLHARALRVCPHPVEMIRMRRTVGQPGHVTEGAGQRDLKFLPSVRRVFVHLSCVGTVEVVFYSTHVGFVTCFLDLLTSNVWLKKRNICARTKQLLNSSCGG